MIKVITLFVVLTAYSITTNAQQSTTPPEFKGGTEQLTEFIKNKVNSLLPDSKVNTPGKVSLLVDVDADGTIRNPSVIIGLDPVCDSVALLVAAAMPRWNPGKTDGKPVKMSTSIIIPFGDHAAGSKATKGSTISIADVTEGSEEENRKNNDRLIIASDDDIILISEVEESSERQGEENRERQEQIALVSVDRTISITDVTESSEIQEEKPLLIAEQMPSFPGGESQMTEFIARNLQYPKTASDAGIQGRVVVRFVVGKEGKVRNAQVIRGIDPACDKEVIRVVNSMPAWNPGKQNGKNVSVYFTIPVIFRQN